MARSGRKICHVTLDDDERGFLREIVDVGMVSAEHRKRAHALLLADEGREDGGHTDADIASILGTGTATVERTRRRCVTEGLAAAPERKVRVNRKRRKPDGAGEAEPVKPACSSPPDGRAGWMLQLPGDRLVELHAVEGVSTETVRRTLKKTASSPG